MLTNKELEKLYEEKQKLKRYCKNCGHSIIIFHKDKICCSHCGNYVFKNDKEEFKYRLLKDRRKYERVD